MSLASCARRKSLSALPVIDPGPLEADVWLFPAVLHPPHHYYIILDIIVRPVTFDEVDRYVATPTQENPGYPTALANEGLGCCG